MLPKIGFQSISTARGIPLGTVADIKMKNGRVYRAAWCERGQVTAWWPLTGKRKTPIGMYDPVEWKRVVGVDAFPSSPVTIR